MNEAVSIGSLWLPIVVSAVIVFVASSIVWMVLPHHRNDWVKLPDEEGIMAAMRKAGVQPGQYAFPNCAGDMKELKNPAYMAKLNQGPVGFLMVAPNGAKHMGSALGQWFVYTLVIGVFVAYVTGRVLKPGSEYLSVFRVAGTVAILCYTCALIPNSIWKSYAWSKTFKEIVDGAVYGLLTAGTFAAFWPSAGA